MSNNFDYEKRLLSDKTKITTKKNPLYDKLNLNSTTTIYELFKNSVNANKNLNYLGQRIKDKKGNLKEYIWDTYDEVFSKVNCFASGLQYIFNKINNKNNLNNNNNDENENENKQYDEKMFENIGIYSINCPEWTISSFGIQFNSMKTVALYDTFGVEAISFIINQADLKVVICSSDKIEKLVEAKKENNLNLKTIIQIDSCEKYNFEERKIKQEHIDLAKENGIELIGFYQLISIGNKNLDIFKQVIPKENYIAFLMYTSGTTGNPKGVMLTHKNAISTLKSALKMINLKNKGNYISFLPLAHIFETVVQLLITACGYSIGFYNGNVKTLIDDIKVLKPRYMAAVPRVLQKIYSKIMDEVSKSNYFKRKAFNFSLQKAIKQTHSLDGIGVPSFLDGFIWSKLRTKLGLDRTELLITGGAPCPNYILEFFRVLLTGNIIQGYGLTETFGVVSTTLPGELHLNNVGQPIGCEIKLLPVEDSDYDAKGEIPIGEICVKGDNIFSGYYENKEETKKAIVDEWFKTGDVGRLNPNGTISVVDRKKALFKLSHGEYISPEKLEHCYGSLSCINQIFVYGNSMKNHVVAVIVPSVQWILDLLSNKNNKTIEKTKKKLKENKLDGFPETIKKIGEENREFLTNKISKEMKSCEPKLPSFERIHSVYLEFEIDSLFNGFNVKNNCLTPSFKLRRNHLAKKYEKQIEEMYKPKK